MRVLVTIILMVPLLASCVRPPRPGPPPAPPVAAPAAGVEYTIDGQASTLTILAYRAGPLASYGHNHVLVVTDLAGALLLPSDPTAISGEVRARVVRFRIDDPADRQQAGADFPGEIPEKDIEGTRHNLEGDQVLDAAHYPLIVATVQGASGGPDRYTVHCTMRVRGTATEQDLPVTVSRDSEALTVDGESTLSQASLGMQPFKIMLGALSVDDTLHLRYHLVARSNRG